MNINTGELFELEQDKFDELKKAFERGEESELIPMTAPLTEKQKDEMKVSLHDTRSPAGKQLHRERVKRGLTKNQKKRLKRKGRLK